MVLPGVVVDYFEVFQTMMEDSVDQGVPGVLLKTVDSIIIIKLNVQQIVQMALIAAFGVEALADDD